MNKKGKDIVEELKEIVPGLNLPSTPPPYGVPDGYFEALPEQVMQRIRTQDADPVQEELTALSPLLATARSASRQQPLSAPDGYFDELAARIMAGLPPQNEETPARVVPIRSRRRYRLWAVAASLLAIISLSTLLLLRQNTGTAKIEDPLASVSDQEIVEYLQAHSDAFDNDAILSNVSNIAVADELPRISTNLNDLPAEAIEKYLESSGLSN